MNYVRKNILAISGYVPGEQPRDRRYIKLNTNENPYPPSPAVGAALAGLAGEALRRYPDPLATALREEAARIAELSGPDWVICGNGSDDLLTIATRVFVDQGGCLATFEPSYSLYPVLAGIQGATCLQIPLAENFAMPTDAASAAAGASILFVARPNAPTGNAYPLREVRKLCQTFNGIVWLDEAYADFADDNCLSLIREFDNLVVSRTLSKSYSLAAIRLGVGFANPALIEQMMKAKDSYNVGTTTQVVGLAALRDQGYMRKNVGRIRQTRAAISRQLAALGFVVSPSQANFIFCRPPMPAADFFATLRAAGVLVRYFPGERTGDYVRITVGSEEEMTAFMETTRSILAAADGKQKIQ